MQLAPRVGIAQVTPGNEASDGEGAAVEPVVALPHLRCPQDLELVAQHRKTIRGPVTIEIGCAHLSEIDRSARRLLQPDRCRLRIYVRIQPLVGPAAAMGAGRSHDVAAIAAHVDADKRPDSGHL